MDFFWDFFRRDFRKWLILRDFLIFCLVPAGNGLKKYLDNTPP